MSSSEYDLQALLDQAGFKRRLGATRAAIGRTEKLLGVQLPDAFLQLWLVSDGMTGHGIDILSLAAIEKYEGTFDGGFGYFPFTECNDSNPYSICCTDPIRGFIAHVYHDDATDLMCRGLPRFLELIAAAQKNGDGAEGVDCLIGDFAFDKSSRTPEDESTAAELLRVAQDMESGDYWRGVALRFAAQLLGSGQETQLSAVMAAGDEYTRKAVRKRWLGIGTASAQEMLRKDDAAYKAFISQFRKALEAAGLQTRPNRFGEYALEPGNIGLNFAMIFAECRQPGVMAEWVQRFVERQHRER